MNINLSEELWLGGNVVALIMSSDEDITPHLIKPHGSADESDTEEGWKLPPKLRRACSVEDVIGIDHYVHDIFDGGTRFTVEWTVRRPD